MILQELLKLQESKDENQVSSILSALKTAAPKGAVLSSAKLLMDEIRFTVLYKNKDDSKGILEKVKQALKGVAECSSLAVKSDGEYFGMKFDLELNGLSSEELEELEAEVKKTYKYSKIS